MIDQQGIYCMSIPFSKTHFVTETTCLTPNKERDWLKTQHMRDNIDSAYTQ